MAESGADEGLYQEAVGEIGLDALASPTERVAYYFLSKEQANSEEMLPFARFGGPNQPLGEIPYRQRLPLFFGAMLPFLLVGVGALFSAASRMSPPGEVRTLAILEKLGVPWSSRMTMVAAAVRVPLAASLALLLLCLVLTSVFGVPLLDYHVLAVDVRDALPVLIPATLAAWAVLALSGVGLIGASALRMRRLRRPHTRRAQSPALGLLGICTLVATPLISQHFADLQNPEHSTVAIVLGLVLALATLPATIGLIVRGCARVLRALANASGSPSMMLTGRFAAAETRSVTRLATISALALITLTQMQLWTGYLGQDSDGLFLADALGGRVLMSRGVSHSTWTAIQAAIPPGVTVLRLDDEDMAGTAPRFAGDPTIISQLFESGLRHAGSPVADFTTQYGAVWNTLDDLGADTVTPVDASTVFDDQTLILIAKDGSDVALADVVNPVAAVLSPPPVFEYPGNGSKVGARSMADQSRWIALFGTAGALMLAISILAACAQEAQRSSAALGAAMAIGITPRVIRQTTALNTVFPAIIGLSVGLVGSGVFGWPILMEAAGMLTFPWWTVFLISTVSVLLGLSFSNFAATSAEEAVVTWVPGSLAADDIS
jgi:hypothetical protein